jgi:hypothetical protein
MEWKSHAFSNPLGCAKPGEYTESMKTTSTARKTTQDQVLDRIFDALGRCLTPQVARRITELRADAELQNHIDALAQKCNEGSLTVSEREEYEAYVRAIHFVTVLQSKARRLLTQKSAS